MRSVQWWWFTTLVAAWNHPGWPTLNRTVLQIDVGADGEHRVRDTVIPSNLGVMGYVGSRVNVPVAAALAVGFARRVTPAGVGDDVTVFAEQRLDCV